MIKITRDDIDTYVSNIVAVWDSATPEQIAQGKAWYATARDIATEIGRGDVRMGAGVIAALSPMTNWSLNQRNASAMADGQDIGTLGASKAKASRILAGEDFDDVLPRGSKTWNFAHNIVGSIDHVTIDRWAIRIAIGASKDTVTELQYSILTLAYLKAAAERGVSGPTMQAATWCAIRGTGE